LVTEAAKVAKTPKIALATKSDLVGPDRMAEHLSEIAALGESVGIEWAAVIPVSATDGFQTELVADELVKQLPAGRPLYPDGDVTDEPEEILVGELIREAALEGVRDELPHSIAVTIDEMGLREGRPEGKPLVDIYANLYLERDSQKGIIIGHKGARLREVGANARRQIEALLGTPVYLDLHVKIAKNWQTDAKHLRKLGF
jgi:GTP-binding protein Era